MASDEAMEKAGISHLKSGAFLNYPEENSNW